MVRRVTRSLFFFPALFSTFTVPVHARPGVVNPQAAIDLPELAHD